jgi:HD-GYP domain-containing protein (c-di-GMP phosphodiesterase class II)
MADGYISSAMSIDQGLKEIQRCGSTQFDPFVVSAFEKMEAAEKIR